MNLTPSPWIAVHLDALLLHRGMTATELADRIGMTQANVSILRTGKAKAIRFTTLLAICQALDCQPGDLLSLEHPDDVPASDGAVRIGPGNVVLIDVGDKKIAVIKALRELGTLGLKEAKELAEDAPTVVLSGLSRVDAEAAMVRLRSVGATVEIT